MASQEPPLDEIQWRSPQIAQSMQGIHSNSVLFYFSHSPFFDPTSNNAVLTNQAMYNQNLMHIIQTREAFEGRLKTMSGLEFIVAQEPAEMAPGTGTGVWVIRKQTRRKKVNEEDEVHVISSYFVVAENIYMAPAVGDVLGSRMLSIFASLNKFISIASTIPTFTPSRGHTYLPPPSKATPLTLNKSFSTSKEPTPLPDSLPDPVSSIPDSQKSASTTAQTSKTASDPVLSRLLEETLLVSLRHGATYMDENPITGAPGDFHLSSSGRPSLLNPPNSNKMPTAVSKDKDKVKAKGPPLKTDIEPPRKGSKSEKSPRTPKGEQPRLKRRKSKISNTQTPGGITPS